jgi:NADPH-dependent curcumin reductase CurA
VYGVFGVQRYAVSDGRGVTAVDTTPAPAPVHLGALGIGGLTAYFRLLDVGRPEPDNVGGISGAAGSVGSVAGQIARIKGCQDLAQWLRSGELRSREHVVAGDVNDFPDVLLTLFRGENTGKLVLALESDR